MVSIFCYVLQILRDDANINVAASAAKCITGLAMGLRRDFSQHAKSIVPIVLAKFKEKKQMLRDPLIACIDALFAATVSGVFWFL